MQIILVYDITNNRIRTKVADTCLDYGLERIQYSAFQGELTRVHQEELMKKIQARLKQAAGKIFLYPICEKDWGRKIEIVQRPQKKTEADHDG